MNSQKYKNYVGRYAILAIRNQLRLNQNFYNKSTKLYQHISKQYKFEDKNAAYCKQLNHPMFQGIYVEKNTKDTLRIYAKQDSLFLTRGDVAGLNLIPLNHNRFYADRKNLSGYFVSFFHLDQADAEWDMRVHLLSDRWTFKKMKTKETEE